MNNRQGLMSNRRKLARISTRMPAQVRRLPAEVVSCRRQCCRGLEESLTHEPSAD